MKYGKRVALLLVFSLLISILTSGCKVESGRAPVRYRNGGELSFLPEEKIEMVKLSEMEYVRPDIYNLLNDYDVLIRKAAECEDVNELLEGYYDVYSRYMSVFSMSNLACFRRDLDSFDYYYKTETDESGALASQIGAKNAELMQAFAKSPLREELEKAYFGEGYFDDYDVEDFGALYYDYQWEEYELENEYLEAHSSPYVIYNGEGKTHNEWQESDSEEVKDGEYEAYINQYHDRFAEIFVNLAKVRRNIANAAGYDDYYEYRCDTYYRYDFTVEQIKDYLSWVKTYISPLLDKIVKKYPTELENVYHRRYPYPKDTDPVNMITSATRNMGGIVNDAAQFMKAYELYDYESSPSKENRGYCGYINEYEAPFIFINPSTFDATYVMTHEFGHFADAYYNYGTGKESMALCEVYSQAMEYLAFEYTDIFNEELKNETLNQALMELLLGSVVRQAIYAAFEIEVYETDPDELTVEKVDEIFYRIKEEFGYPELYTSETEKKRWAGVNHFYMDSGYVISYSVSAIASLQIVEMEYTNKGMGVAAYNKLLQRDHEKDFLGVLKDTGIVSPFDEYTIKEIAEFLKEALGLY